MAKEIKHKTIYVIVENGGLWDVCSSSKAGENPVGPRLWKSDEAFPQMLRSGNVGLKKKEAEVRKKQWEEMVG